MQAHHRLAIFNLHNSTDPDFEIARSILQRSARRVGEVYARRYLEIVGSEPDFEKREAFVQSVTAAFQARYDVPAGEEWVAKGEEIAKGLHRRGGSPTEHLGALSEAQTEEIIVVFEGVENPSDAIRIAAKMSRLQALDAEILLTTVKQIQTRKHFDWINQKARSVHDVLGKMAKNTAQKSGDSRREAEDSGRLTAELTELSDTVSKASQATAQAMEEAAAEAQNLRHTMDQAVLELSDASQSIRGAISAGNTAVATVDALSNKSASIQSIAALIEDIADRTGILALNATIEAARAGEAGAGFGVVANEMKALSEQTTAATRDIFAHVDAIQSAREEALQANKSVLDTFENVTKITDAVRNDVSSKSKTVTQIVERVDQTAQNANQSRETIVSMNALASGLAERVAVSGASLTDLTRQIEGIERGIHGFMQDLSDRSDFDQPPPRYHGASDKT